LNLAATVTLLGLGSASLLYAILLPDQEKLERVVETAALVGAAEIAQDGSIQEGVSSAVQAARDGGLDLHPRDILFGTWDAEAGVFEARQDTVNAVRVIAEHYSFAPAFSQITVRYDVQSLEASSTVAINGDTPKLVTHP